MANFDPDKLGWKRICINKNLWTDILLAFPAGDKGLSWAREGSWVQPGSDADVLKIPLRMRAWRNIL